MADPSAPTVKIPMSTFSDGMAYDWINEKLYLADASFPQINVLDIHTGAHVTILDEEQVNGTLGAIVVDPRSR